MKAPKTPKEALQVLYRSMTEAQLFDQIYALAKPRGWHCVHFMPGLTSKGAWLTRMAGDAGFPDVVLARKQVVLFAELKREGKVPTEEQMRWIHATGAHIWRPSDLPKIQELLTFLDAPNRTSQSR